MKKWKRSVLTLLTATLLAAGVSAEDLYVKNKLFKGATSGSGSAITAHAQSLLEAFQVTDYRIDGQNLIIGDKTLTLAEGTDGPMVGVKAFVDALGGTMVVSKELGTVDVFQNTEKVAEAAPPVARTPSDPPPSAKPPVIKATQSAPGAEVDLASDAVYGKENIVLFYADW